MDQWYERSRKSTAVLASAVPQTQDFETCESANFDPEFSAG
jgi:hypothetical protein